MESCLYNFMLVDQELLTWWDLCCSFNFHLKQFLEFVLSTLAFVTKVTTVSFTASMNQISS